MLKRVIADCIVRYEVVEPKDGLYGGKTPDGNLTGLIGMLIREVRFNPKYYYLSNGKEGNPMTNSPRRVRTHRP